ncbi:MAG TPA: hypothetical protein VHO01_08655 [Jatrophihabitans sp.]|nr:hypothetical protein [Jatrophihabitans sp.]
MPPPALADCAVDQLADAAEPPAAGDVPAAAAAVPELDPLLEQALSRTAAAAASPRAAEVVARIVCSIQIK